MQRTFDLEAARRGAPILTTGMFGIRNRLSFVAHLPQAQPHQRLVVYDETDDRVELYHEDGTYMSDRSPSTLDAHTEF